MKKITIISVVKRPPEWVTNAVQEYSKRLSKKITLKWIDVTPIRRGKNNSINKLLEQEAQLITKVLPQDSLTIALDEKGTRKTTRDLSAQLKSWFDLEQSVCFIIGGPDGLHSSLKNSSNAIWRLSDLTLPHAMVKVMLVEQLYRAWCILDKHPYHRE